MRENIVDHSHGVYSHNRSTSQQYFSTGGTQPMHHPRQQTSDPHSVYQDLPHIPVQHTSDSSPSPHLPVFFEASYAPLWTTPGTVKSRLPLDARNPGASRHIVVASTKNRHQHSSSIQPRAPYFGENPPSLHNVVDWYLNNSGRQFKKSTTSHVTGARTAVAQQRLELHHVSPSTSQRHQIVSAGQASSAQTQYESAQRNTTQYLSEPRYVAPNWDSPANVPAPHLQHGASLRPAPAPNSQASIYHHINQSSAVIPKSSALLPPPRQHKQRTRSTGAVSTQETSSQSSNFDVRMDEPHSFRFRGGVASTATRFGAEEVHIGTAFASREPPSNVHPQPCLRMPVSSLKSFKGSPTPHFVDSSRAPSSASSYSSAQAAAKPIAVSQRRPDHSWLEEFFYRFKVQLTGLVNELRGAEDEWNRETFNLALQSVQQCCRTFLENIDRLGAGKNPEEEEIRHALAQWAVARCQDVTRYGTAVNQGLRGTHMPSFVEMAKLEDKRFSTSSPNKGQQRYVDPLSSPISDTSLVSGDVSESVRSRVDELIKSKDYNALKWLRRAAERELGKRKERGDTDGISTARKYLAELSEAVVANLYNKQGRPIPGLKTSLPIVHHKAAGPPAAPKPKTEGSMSDLPDEVKPKPPVKQQKRSANPKENKAKPAEAKKLSAVKEAPQAEKKTPIVKKKAASIVVAPKGGRADASWTKGKKQKPPIKAFGEQQQVGRANTKQLIKQLSRQGSKQLGARAAQEAAEIGRQWTLDKEKSTLLNMKPKPPPKKQHGRTAAAPTSAIDEIVAKKAIASVGKRAAEHAAEVARILTQDGLDEGMPVRQPSLKEVLKSAPAAKRAAKEGKVKAGGAKERATEISPFARALRSMGTVSIHRPSRQLLEEDIETLHSRMAEQTAKLLALIAEEDGDEFNGTIDRTSSSFVSQDGTPYRGPADLDSLLSLALEETFRNQPMPVIKESLVETLPISKKGTSPTPLPAIKTPATAAGGSAQAKTEPVDKTPQKANVKAMSDVIAKKGAKAAAIQAASEAAEIGRQMTLENEEPKGLGLVKQKTLKEVLRKKAVAKTKALTKAVVKKGAAKKADVKKPPTPPSDKRGAVEEKGAFMKPPTTPSEKGGAIENNEAFKKPPTTAPDKRGGVPVEDKEEPKPNPFLDRLKTDKERPKAQKLLGKQQANQPLSGTKAQQSGSKPQKPNVKAINTVLAKQAAKAKAAELATAAAKIGRQMTLDREASAKQVLEKVAIGKNAAGKPLAKEVAAPKATRKAVDSAGKEQPPKKELSAGKQAAKAKGKGEPVDKKKQEPNKNALSDIVTKQAAKAAALAAANEAAGIGKMMTIDGEGAQQLTKQKTLKEMLAKSGGKKKAPTKPPHKEPKQPEDGKLPASGKAKAKTKAKGVTAKTPVTKAVEEITVKHSAKIKAFKAGKEAAEVGRLLTMATEEVGVHPLKKQLTLKEALASAAEQAAGASDIWLVAKITNEAAAFALKTGLSPTGDDSEAVVTVQAADVAQALQIADERLQTPPEVNAKAKTMVQSGVKKQNQPGAPKGKGK
eukprot:GHVN01065916.1.p1 GENE.GHVN01065916.1~~GHVN01065916.1.p1  ORF type:complete len:1546 (-),score=305.86 GHVN01065916.1:27-4664(-)